MAVATSITILSCSKVDLNGFKQEPTQDGISYTIKKGNHYSDHNPYEATGLISLSLLVKFDSSAIYQTNQLENQLDVNKLYGFSDNGAQHHMYSARFGWRWSENSLRLFAYVYNEGQMSYEEITTINIGQTYKCSITVSGNRYIFNVDGYVLEMPRASITSGAEGYKLYPYFGGNEPAPHDIRIWIKEI